GKIFAIVAFLALGAVAGRAHGDLRGVEAPDFVLKSLSGKNLRLSEYRGEVVMLSFWASWCGDCRHQLEELATVYQRYRDAGVAVLAVSLDGDSRRARDAAAALEIGYPVLLDPEGDVGRLYEVDSMPLALLIDRAGLVRHVFEGRNRAAGPVVLEQVRVLLRE